MDLRVNVGGIIGTVVAQPERGSAGSTDEYLTR